MSLSLEQEMLKEFLIEAKELLEELDNNFVILESKPNDSDLINEIFRSVHTIKGGAGMVGNEKLQTVAHRMEDILNKIRKGETSLSTDIIDPLLSGLDVLKQITECLVRDEDISDIDISVVNILEEAYKKMGEASNNKDESEVSAKEEKSAIDAKAAKLAAEADQEQDEFEVDMFGEEMEELVDSFTIETEEILETVDQDLIELEHNPDDEETLNSIFRGLHTIKGTSSFLGLDLITKLSHNAEDVLNDLRKKVLTVNSEIMDVLLDAVDFLKVLMDDVRNKELVDRDIVPLVTQLMAFRGDSSPDNQSNENKGVSKSTEQKKNKDIVKKNSSKSVVDATIRVDVERLDSLMNLVSELVLRRNSLMQITNKLDKEAEDSEYMEELTSTAGHISYLTTELQFSVMQTRMLPIGKVFNKFSRIVRDLSRDFNKKIELTIEGAETELDKSLIEEINDPLVHLIRNAVDHGIETPEKRIAAGKDEVGKVKLYATQEGNNIIIGIEDDGNGLDANKLKAAAVKKGVITKAEAERMTEKEAFNIIFAPGFSTAEKVTNVSGRGVGMDVVKTNIAKLNGMIDIQSVLGEGTKIVIKLPLTLAIIQGLLVEVNEEVYVIPLSAVLETSRVNVEDISYMNQREAIRLRDSILPLVRLDALFGIPKINNEEESFVYVVVVGMAEHKLGLVVSKMLGQEEVVIKSLGEELGQTPGVSGATIMGDGRVRMILEIRDLFDLAAKTKGISPKEIRRKLAKEKSNTEEITDETDLQSNENENVEEKEISDDEDAEDFSDEKYEGEIPEDYSEQESDEKLDKEEMVLEQ
ncbi:MAG: chemotaxis protein CheA [Candidatus Marinimicrobia bacterium]|nr:chemotaxis protein CheA [Candidatus Neomarinimicrobiota bacterium]